MRILIAHSRYRSGAVSGENRVVDDEASLLRANGHEAQVWSPSPEGLRGLRLAKAGVGAIWSHGAASAVRRLMDRVRPDVVHCHNLFPMLSPSVLRAVPDTTPVVMTLHNYRLLCLPATLLRDGAVCELCVGRVPWRGVLYRCHRDSALQSGVLASSIELHRMMGTFERVDVNLAVSGFVRDKHLAAGFAPDRVRVKPNFVWAASRRRGPGDYFVFVGRLSPEKGLDGLMDLDWSSIGRLVVAGDGPEAAALKAKASGRINFVGRVFPRDVPRLMAGARAVVMPSLSYEGAPRAILEAYAAGVPVVAARIGGLPELVEDGVSGLLVPPRGHAGWVTALRSLLDDRESERLGDGAWQRWRERYAPEPALAALERAYADAIELKARA